MNRSNPSNLLTVTKRQHCVPECHSIPEKLLDGIAKRLNKGTECSTTYHIQQKQTYYYKRVCCVCVPFLYGHFPFQSQHTYCAFVSWFWTKKKRCQSPCHKKDPPPSILAWFPMRIFCVGGSLDSPWFSIHSCL